MQAVYEEVGKTRYKYMLVLDIEYVYVYKQQLSAVQVMATCSQGHKRGGGFRGFHQTPSKLMIFMMPYGKIDGRIL